MARIETLDGPLKRWRLTDGADCAELVPERGAIVSSFVRGGVPLLYLDEATLLDPSKNVRGGVPVLFPFAGRPPAGTTLPQHGFARRLPWLVTSAVADDDTARVECTLESSAQTMQTWPHPFRLRASVSLYAGRLVLEWAFENRGDRPMPLHFGIHPYFEVANKAQARVDGATGPAFDNTTGRQCEVDRIDFATAERDLHFTPFTNQGTTLHRGDGTRLRLSWTEHFSTLVLWTLPGQPFVCVEPWTARGAQPSELLVAPGATERLAVQLWLESD